MINEEPLIILADLKNGDCEIGFELSEITIGEVDKEYAEMICKAYNFYINEWVK